MRMKLITGQGERYICNWVMGIQGVSENTDTFLSLPAVVFITSQTSLGARIDP